MLKEAMLTLRLTPVVREALDRAARSELRPVANLVAKLIVEELMRRKLLSEADAQDALQRAPRGTGKGRGRKRTSKQRR